MCGNFAETCAETLRKLRGNFAETCAETCGNMCGNFAETYAETSTLVVHFLEPLYETKIFHKFRCLFSTLFSALSFLFFHNLSELKV